ncbi:MAG: hypothetical protein GY756_15920 [bacterium]|nr:hypothetical protein [bacterium]
MNIEGIIYNKNTNVMEWGPKIDVTRQRYADNKMWPWFADCKAMVKGLQEFYSQISH